MRRPDCSAFSSVKTSGRTLNIHHIVSHCLFEGSNIHDGAIPDVKSLAWSVGDETCLVNVPMRQRLLQLPIRLVLLQAGVLFMIYYSYRAI